MSLFNPQNLSSLKLRMTSRLIKRNYQSKKKNSSGNKNRNNLTLKLKKNMIPNSMMKKKRKNFQRRDLIVRKIAFLKMGRIR